MLLSGLTFRTDRLYNNVLTDSPKYIYWDSRSEPVISRLPFGPPAKEMSKLIDENVRRHTEENNIKQSMKAVYAQAQSTSNGLFAQRLSKNNNYIIPVLPRATPQ